MHNRILTEIGELETIIDAIKWNIMDHTRQEIEYTDLIDRGIEDNVYEQFKGGAIMHFNQLEGNIDSQLILLWGKLKVLMEKRKVPSTRNLDWPI